MVNALIHRGNLNEKKDGTSKAHLLETVNLQTIAEKLQEDRAKRLWKKVDMPCNFSDALSRLTKNELDRIRKNYGFNKLSTLRKADLVIELSKLIPKNIKRIIYTLDQGRYDLIKLIIEHSGAIFDLEMSVEYVESMMKFGLLFPGVCNDEKVVFMPDELIKSFTQIDGDELKNIVKRNTEWIRLAFGLLFYYGVMSASLLYKKVEELTGQTVDMSEFNNVFSFACDFYRKAHYTPYGYMDSRVVEVKNIIEEQKMRPKVEYYPFNKEQLLRASEPGFLEITPEMESFMDLLIKHNNFSTREINELALTINEMINNGLNPITIIQYLNRWVEFPSFEYVQQLTAKLMDLYNHTRQWILKGHTPYELFQEEKKYLKPLPAEPFRNLQTKSNVIDLSIRNKVGRNAPCPCGSGKKYKKCCGK